jgi:hypothetical protein
MTGHDFGSFHGAPHIGPAELQKPFNPGQSQDDKNRGEALFLSRAVQRVFRGRVQSLDASRFLRDIESELTRHQRTPPMRRRAEDLQMRLL